MNRSAAACKTGDDWEKRSKNAGAKLHEAGITLCYHNHDFEFEILDGKYGLDWLYQSTNAQYLQAELDTYWIQKGGANPVEYLKSHAGRVPLLHIKDMTADGDFAESVREFWTGPPFSPLLKRRRDQLYRGAGCLRGRSVRFHRQEHGDLQKWAKFKTEIARKRHKNHKRGLVGAETLEKSTMLFLPIDCSNQTPFVIFVPFSG
jgi:hypothetical protein